MKTFLKPLLFIAVLLGLGGIAYWDEWQTKKDEKEKASKNKLLSLNPNDIVKFEYTKVDEGKTLKVRLAKEDGRWKVLAPIDFPADGEGVNRLLKTFEDLRYEKTFEATPEKAREFGLDQPKIQLLLTDSVGKQTEIRIGGKSPVGYSSYIKVDASSSVYLVSQATAVASNKELFDFRNKSLRWPDLDAVKAIGYQFENDPIITLKRIDKDWLIEAPKKFKADATAVKQFLSFFEGQKVTRFMDEPSPVLREALTGKKSGTHRVATLVLTSPDEKITQYALLENGEDIYTTMAGYPGILVLDRKIKDGLKKTVADFQDRAMFSYNSTEATAVDLDGKVFVKKGDSWQKKEGGEAADFLKLLLVDFEFAKADLVLTKDEGPALIKGAPLHSVKVTFKEGKTLEFAVWKIEGDAEHVALKVNPDGFFKAPKQLLENFDQRPKLSEKLQPGDQG